MAARDTTTDRGDRSGDRRTRAGGADKPPVLGRATQRALCLLCLTGITFGTLGPLGLGGRPWLAWPDAWQWVPAGQAGDLNDLITNLAVYVPVGVAFRLLVRRRGTAGWPDLLLGVGLSVALSYLTELLQQLMPARSASRVDVLVNGSAAFAGCLLAVPAQCLIRRGHASIFVRLRTPASALAVCSWLTAALAVVLMTMPWNLARPAAEWGFDRLWNTADLRRFAVFLAVGFFMTAAAVTRERARAAVVFGALVRVLLLAAALEATQAVLGAHVCSAAQAVVAWAGATTGWLAAQVLLRRRGTIADEKVTATAPAAESPLPTETLRRLAAAALVGTAVYAAAVGLWQIGPLTEIRTEPVVHWLPFREHFIAPFAAMAAGIVEQVTVYALLTLSCLYLTRGRGRAIALLLLLGLVSLIELCRAFLDHHGADPTAAMLAAFAWLVTTRIWMAVYPSQHGEPWSLIGAPRHPWPYGDAG